MLAVIVFALILISHFLWRWCYYSCCSGTPAAWVQRKLCAAAEVMDKFLFLYSPSTSAGVMDLQYFLCWRVAPLFLLSKPFFVVPAILMILSLGKKKKKSKEGKKYCYVALPFFLCSLFKLRQWHSFCSSATQRMIKTTLRRCTVTQKCLLR